MRARILLFTVLISVLGLVVYAMFSVDVYNDYEIESIRQSLKIYAKLYDEADGSDGETARALSEELGGARVTFISEEGVVLSDSALPDLAGADHADRAEFIEARRSGEGFSVRASESAGSSSIYYCKKAGGIYLRISVEAISSWGLLLKMLPTLLWLIVLESLLCGVCAYISTSFVLKPVQELVKKAATDEKIDTKYAELQPIAEAVNRMKDTLAEKVEEIEAEKEQVVKATASKNEFVSNITHEMNTPLTSIKGFAELLTTPLPEEQRKKALDIIIRQSDRLSNLVECVINYNQLDNDDLPSYEVNLSKIAEETAEILKPDMEKRGITLTADIEKDVSVFSRHERIVEIVGNLVRNAIKYNKENGAINLVVAGGKTPVLKVKDTGIGVAAENKEKIFDRFFTVDKSHGGKHGGFGLGLATVKKICARSGWNLSVESELGVGTQFTIEFTAAA
ncbi:MAG: hypothetical protein DBX59_04065 [Bacillota bacterium]|nr:MAG: hypothetical protein DBX59_04065 [Bacillota bacterium]